jgi:hypothetical protein
VLKLASFQKSDGVQYGIKLNEHKSRATEEPGRSQETPRRPSLPWDSRTEQAVDPPAAFSIVLSDAHFLPLTISLCITQWLRSANY